MRSYNFHFIVAINIANRNIYTTTKIFIIGHKPTLDLT